MTKEFLEHALQVIANSNKWRIENGEDSFYTEARLNAFRVAKKALLRYKPSMKG